MTSPLWLLSCGSLAGFIIGASGKLRFPGWAYWLGVALMLLTAWWSAGFDNRRR